MRQTGVPPWIGGTPHVNGRVEVPGYGREKSPPLMAVRASAAGHLLGFEPLPS